MHAQNHTKKVDVMCDNAGNRIMPVIGKTHTALVTNLHFRSAALVYVRRPFVKMSQSCTTSSLDSWHLCRFVHSPEVLVFVSIILHVSDQEAYAMWRRNGVPLFFSSFLPWICLSAFSVRHLCACVRAPAHVYVCVCVCPIWCSGMCSDFR